jgi:outer membrane immunogenic protein
MKIILIASIAAAAFVGAPAFAADMPVKGPIYRAPPPAFSWTGCYGGIEGGGAWGQTRHVQPDTGLTLTSGNASGGLVGGTIGCNYQSGAWVWGIEDDFSWTGFKGAHNSIPPFDPTIVRTTSTHWLDTLRGRLGYAVDRSLWYVTGGVAFSDIRASAAEAGFPTASITHDRSGWAIGGGVEWALPDPHWSVKAEYLYIDFGKKFYGLNAIGGGVFSNANVRMNENIVRVGLNYKFDWGKSPVVAKY